jgi:hypothetical protein
MPRGLVLLLGAAITVSVQAHGGESDCEPGVPGGVRFGHAVAISGETAVIGAHQEYTTAGFHAGAAYVFVRAGTSWSLQARLTPSDAAANDEFGCAVSIDRDTVVVGSQRSESAGGIDTGAAYVFVRSAGAWTEQQKLVAADGERDDRFGHSVSIHGDTVVVGAYSDSSSTSSLSGSVYVFVRSGSTWTEQQHLTTSDGGSDLALFGSAVSIFEDTLVVGAENEPGPFGEQGVGGAYLFVRSDGTWSEVQRLAAPDGRTANHFGWSASIFVKTVVIGAPHGGIPGRVYVFVRTATAWTLEQTLPTYGESAGQSVSIFEDTVAVGYPSPGGAPRVYVFVRSGGAWSQQQLLAASDGEADDGFGISVAVSQDTLIAGSWLDDIAGELNAGSAYAFVRSGSTWNEQQKLLPGRGYFTLTPCRVADTRATSTPLVANTTRAFAVGGVCGVPTDARAVAAILTAVNPGDVGNLRLYPTGQPAPLASSINFAAGLTRANNAITPLGAGGQIEVQCDMPAGSAASTHFVLDVFGFFR